jgi:hypothetical protein
MLAEDRAYLPGRVVVIDVRRAHGERFGADRTTAALRFPHRVIVSQRDPVLLAKNAIFLLFRPERSLILLSITLLLIAVALFIFVFVLLMRSATYRSRPFRVGCTYETLLLTILFGIRGISSATSSASFRLSFVVSHSMP